MSPHTVSLEFPPVVLPFHLCFYGEPLPCVHFQLPPERGAGRTNGGPPQ